MNNLQQKFKNDKKFRSVALHKYKSFLTQSILSGDRCDDWQSFEHENISYDINLHVDDITNKPIDSIFGTKTNDMCVVETDGLNFCIIPQKYNKKFKVKDLETGDVKIWSISKIVSEINRDRSEDWKPYTPLDWYEGWTSWCEGDIYTLNIHGENLL